MSNPAPIRCTATTKNGKNKGTQCPQTGGHVCPKCLVCTKHGCNCKRPGGAKKRNANALKHGGDTWVAKYLSKRLKAAYNEAPNATDARHLVQISNALLSVVCEYVQQAEDEGNVDVNIIQVGEVLDTALKRSAMALKLQSEIEKNKSTIEKNDATIAALSQTKDAALDISISWEEVAELSVKLDGAGERLRDITRMSDLTS